MLNGLSNLFSKVSPEMEGRDVRQILENLQNLLLGALASTNRSEHDSKSAMSAVTKRFGGKPRSGIIRQEHRCRMMPHQCQACLFSEIQVKAPDEGLELFLSRQLNLFAPPGFRGLSHSPRSMLEDFLPNLSRYEDCREVV